MVKDGEDGRPSMELDFDDEIIAGACVTRDGEIVHEGAKAAAGGLGGDLMFVTKLAILVLAGFVGYEVISKVPNTLHTPLMSGTNAIHGIVVLGGLLVLGLSEDRSALNKIAARDRDHLRHDQRRRRLPRHRPDARDVQEQAGAAKEVEEERGRAAARVLPPGPGLHRHRSTSSASSCSSSACGG